METSQVSGSRFTIHWKSQGKLYVRYGERLWGTSPSFTALYSVVCTLFVYIGSTDSYVYMEVYMEVFMECQRHLSSYATLSGDLSIKFEAQFARISLPCADAQYAPKKPSLGRIFSGYRLTLFCYEGFARDVWIGCYASGQSSHPRSLFAPIWTLFDIDMEMGVSKQAVTSAYVSARAATGPKSHLTALCVCSSSAEERRFHHTCRAKKLRQSSRCWSSCSRKRKRSTDYA